MAAAALPRTEISVAPRPRARPATATPSRSSTAPIRRTVRRNRTSPFRRALLIAGLPALGLVVYVGLWTGAMRGGYTRNRLESQIRSLAIENNSLQAEVRRLQSPSRIFTEASQLGMQRPADMTFVEIPPVQR